MKAQPVSFWHKAAPEPLISNCQARPPTYRAFPISVVRQYRVLAEVFRELGFSLNEQSVYDPAIVCNDIPYIQRERSLGQICVLREQQKIQFFLEILCYNAEALMRQLYHSFLRNGGNQITSDVVVRCRIDMSSVCLTGASSGIFGRSASPSP
jgi:hypothetical protein